MTPWFTVYRRLAILLRRFYKKHKENSGERLYQLCEQDAVFRLLNQWVSRFSDDPETQSFDPIHIFTSLNDSKLGNQTRVKRIDALFTLLGNPGYVKAIDFEGCPTPFTIKILATRPKAAQLEIWFFFNEVLGLGNKQIEEYQFPNYHNWYGINLSSLTIFLFWINHKKFLPLDNNVQRLLARMDNISVPKSFKEYVKLIERTELQDYLEISIQARNFQVSYYREPLERITVRKSETKPQRSNEIKSEQKFPASIRNGCRMVGLRVYDPTPDAWVKMLTRGKIYTFYRAFSFDENELKFDMDNDAEIHYEGFRDPGIYDLKTHAVNISAVAGENGSGKSTLLDLIFLAINNLTANDRSSGKNLTYVDGLCLDFFFFTDSLYKLTIDGSLVRIVRYKFDGSYFNDPDPVSILGFELEQFFYSIAINHSLYGLNSDNMGDWLLALFDKNDQYQVPIVINPYRVKGNIDVNKETDLARTRLLATLLQPMDKEELENERSTLRTLSSDRTAEKLSITLNENKFKKEFKHRKGQDIFKIGLTDHYWNPLLKELCRVFGISLAYPPKGKMFPENSISAAFNYLVRKVVTICLNYPQYESYIEPARYNIPLNSIPDLVNELFLDTSHATHKFYQTIHFLREDHLSEIRQGQNLENTISFDIDDLAFRIDKVRSQINNQKFKVVHFIPPPFLNVDIILTGDISLNELSSGEKQRIFSVSGLAYHLINLDSNMDTDSLRKYSSVNILFDEVELYFHPEMQRSFIKYLLDYLNGLELETSFYINILFVTHSPFILSDIPSDNVLFLGKRVVPGLKTFGSNIHTLLAESFFMHNGFMGEFAKLKINSLIDFLLSNLKGKEWNERSAAEVIALVGEPLIRERLTDIYRAAYQKVNETDIRISALEQEIKILKREKN